MTLKDAGTIDIVRLDQAPPPLSYVMLITCSTGTCHHVTITSCWQKPPPPTPFPHLEHNKQPEALIGTQHPQSSRTFTECARTSLAPGDTLTQPAGPEGSGVTQERRPHPPLMSIMSMKTNKSVIHVAFHTDVCVLQKLVQLESKRSPAAKRRALSAAAAPSAGCRGPRLNLELEQQRRLSCASQDWTSSLRLVSCLNAESDLLTFIFLFFCFFSV